MTTPNSAARTKLTVTSSFLTGAPPAYAQFDSRSTRSRKGFAAWEERRAKEALTREHDLPVSLEQIARACGMSQRSFARRFKDSTGETPHQWLMGQRLLKAKDLLLSGVALAEVAQACSFADQSHFTRTFTRLVGHPPGRWLRLHRE